MSLHLRHLNNPTRPLQESPGPLGPNSLPGLLWPGVPPRSVRNSLETFSDHPKTDCCVRLRRLIRDCFLETGFYTTPPLERKIPMDTLTSSPAALAYEVSGLTGRFFVSKNQHHCVKMSLPALDDLEPRGLEGTQTLLETRRGFRARSS